MRRSAPRLIIRQLSTHLARQITTTILPSSRERYWVTIRVGSPGSGPPRPAPPRPATPRHATPRSRSRSRSRSRPRPRFSSERRRRRFLELAGTVPAFGLAGCSALKNDRGTPTGTGAGDGVGATATATVSVRPDREKLDAHGSNSCLHSGPATSPGARPNSGCSESGRTCVRRPSNRSRRRPVRNRISLSCATGMTCLQPKVDSTGVLHRNARFARV